MEILKKAPDAGLVRGLSNWEKNPDTNCNCDPLWGKSSLTAVLPGCCV